MLHDREDGIVAEVLPRLGVPGDWSQIAHDSSGVRWSRVAPAYQAILSRAQRDVRG